MMDIFFTNPNDVPVPPEKMGIRELKATPYADGKRVAIEFEITPFQQKPNIEIGILNRDHEEVSSLSVVEAIENTMSFTLHLREPRPHGEYQVKMQLFYTDLKSLDDEEDKLIKDLLLENKRHVVTAETIFSITAQDA
ncbi:MAG TPA: hypothetical protein DCY42_09315 [Chloroflexi bacterium]|nr:hypothetical protein [Chloroflexota bacterium]